MNLLGHRNPGTERLFCRHTAWSLISAISASEAGPDANAIIDTPILCPRSLSSLKPRDAAPIKLPSANPPQPLCSIFSPSEGCTQLSNGVIPIHRFKLLLDPSEANQSLKTTHEYSWAGAHVMILGFVSSVFCFKKKKKNPLLSWYNEIMGAPRQPCRSKNYINSKDIRNK